MMIVIIYILIVVTFRDDERRKKSIRTVSGGKISPVQYRVEVSTYFRKMPGGAISSHVGVNKTMSKNEKKNEVGSGAVQP